MENPSHLHWMQQALETAERALPLDVPVGALIVDAHGQCIGRGHNTREQDNQVCGHAELMALAQASQALQNWRLSHCTLYVTLEPCPMCAGAILQSRLSTVVFGASDPLQGALGSRWQLAEGTALQVIPGVLEQPCRQQLQAFFQQKRTPLV